MVSGRRRGGCSGFPRFHDDVPRSVGPDHCCGSTHTSSISIAGLGAALPLREHTQPSRMNARCWTLDSRPRPSTQTLPTLPDR
jgi:hypothetical protein